MANTDIYPYGQNQPVPEGYPVSTSLDENDAQKAAASSLTYQLKRMIGSGAGGGGDFAQIIAARARQMANIEWSPVKNITMNNNESMVTKAAGTKFKGLPYSSVKEIDKYIGYDVSLYTFMTAVNNQYSLFYTECVHGSHSASAIAGRTYNGNNCATYFGVVCNVFAQYCNMASVPFNTGEHAWMATHKSNFSAISDQSAQGVKVGDIIWSSGHDRCVTDVVRAADGTVTQVTFTESVHHVVTSSAKTAAEFNTYLSQKSCIIYRYTGLSPIYFPSPFVPAAGEDPASFLYNDDICTFAGDKACFKEGDVIRINYNLKSVGDWTKMYVYKREYGDLTQAKEVTLDTSANVVDLTGDNLEPGMYAARLFNGTKYSEFTYFEVVEADVAATVSGSITHITFGSSNGRPLYYEVCDNKGGTYAIDELTELDRQLGYVDVNLLALNQAQYPSKAFVSTMYVKVHFEGKYGRVASKVSKP